MKDLLYLFTYVCLDLFLNLIHHHHIDVLLQS